MQANGWASSRDISKLEFRNKLISDLLDAQYQEVPLKEFRFKLNVSEEQRKELALYVNSLAPSELLFGLRFAYNRHTAERGGYLMPGRKSLVKRETVSLSPDQAKWRLNNWKIMIRTYREKGYSYPTISRIKKELGKILDSK
ncbi:MAG: hypothetical protein M3258_03990 [Thermoproteota archaeon]|nr:hypothetical protein [Thermoproteota archaeon]